VKVSFDFIVVLHFPCKSFIVIILSFVITVVSRTLVVVTIHEYPKHAKSPRQTCKRNETKNTKT
jgi:hypothetical protein